MQRNSYKQGGVGVNGFLYDVKNALFAQNGFPNDKCQHK